MSDATGVFSPLASRDGSYRRAWLGIAVLAGTPLLFRGLSDAFPRLSLTIAELIAIAIILVSVAVASQLRRGLRYSLLTFYSLIFLSEFVVGTFVATTTADIVVKEHLASSDVTTALSLGVAGYVMVLIGYFVPGMVRRRLGPDRPLDLTKADQRFEPRYRAVLFILMALMTALGFVQLLLRVQKAGGFAAYLAIAYTLRYGTYADSDVSNAWAVLASLLAAGALPCAALLYIAWMRKKLSTFEKWLLVVLTVLLMVRQASTAFRAVVVFTLISAFAVYDSERPVGWRQLVGMGLLIGLVLIGVNYVHIMLHALTGVGAEMGFGESSEELMAPHAYLQTLSTLIDARHRLAPLNGEGMLTSILFFIPRAIWTSKPPSDQFGTGLVQSWAGLTTTYQMAVTNVGEFFVHFGTVGILGLLAWGFVYRWLDDHWWSGPEWRTALLCIALPRVFPDQGMGLSAFAISIVSIAGFLVPLAFAKRLAGLR